MFIRMGPRRQTNVPIAALVPNVITTLSLCSGLASIHFSLLANSSVIPETADPARWPRSCFAKAVVMIGLAMIFDALDGRAARLLRVSSKFGAVLDSLSDFVSFGVAPAIILHQWLLAPVVSPLELAAVMVYALCAGLRLARFTSATPAPKSVAMSNFFVGMPTPAAAGAVLIPAMIHLSEDTAWKPGPWLSTTLALVIGFLMVSRVPAFAFKKLSINRRLVAPLLILVGLLVVSLATHLWLTLAALAGLNLALTPFAWLSRRRARAVELNEATIPLPVHERNGPLHE